MKYLKLLLIILGFVFSTELYAEKTTQPNEERPEKLCSLAPLTPLRNQAVCQEIYNSKNKDCNELRHLGLADYLCESSRDWSTSFVSIQSRQDSIQEKNLTTE